MDSVWVVSMHMDHEGSEIQGVFSTNEEAQQYVKQYIEDYGKSRAPSRFQEIDPGVEWNYCGGSLCIEQYILHDDAYWPWRQEQNMANIKG